METRNSNDQLRFWSRLHFDTNHMRVPTPMRPADWSVAASPQRRTVQNQSVTPGRVDLEHSVRVSLLPREPSIEAGIFSR